MKVKFKASIGFQQQREEIFDLKDLGIEKDWDELSGEEQDELLNDWLNNFLNLSYEVIE